ncbi:MAG: cupin domain-containing protein [Sphingomonadales bacterium]
MHINADFTKPARVDAAAMPWLASPMQGVERRMLDRVGDEVARATSLVRYAPGSYFSPHHHDGGEEFLVLDGVFSDEHGDYGPGYYVRNPQGSSHKPFSKDGCVIFVKLWQMDAADQNFVRIDTAKADFGAADRDGVRRLALHAFGGVETAIEIWPAGTESARVWPGGAEILVLEGGLQADADRPLSALGWLRYPAGAAATLRCSDGARLFVKTGHLAKAQAAPGGSAA